MRPCEGKIALSDAVMIESKIIMLRRKIKQQLFLINNRPPVYSNRVKQLFFGKTNS